MKTKIYAVVIKTAQEFNEIESEKHIPVEHGKDAALFGITGSLDSLGLVSFIVSVEQAIEDEFGATIQIVSEKAMSQKNSPFLTIETLIDFIEKLLQEDARE